MSAYEQSRFTQNAPCLPCCFAAPDEPCACGFRMPFLIDEVTPDGVYADYATAKAALDDFASCYVVGFESLDFTSTTPGVLASLNSAWDATTNTLSMDGATVSNDIFMFFTGAISVPQSSTVTFAWTVGGDASGLNIKVYRCDDQFNGPSPVFTYSGESPGVWNVGTDTDWPETFLFIIQVFPDEGTAPLTASITATVDTDAVANPVFAAYGDPDSPTLLDACPRLNIVIAEGVDYWFVNIEDAQEFYSDFTSNCVGIFDDRGGPPNGTFTATEIAGVSLELQDLNEVGSIEMWGGVSILQGETISIAYDGSTNFSGSSGDGFDVVVDIDVYNQDKVLLETFNTLSSSVPISGTFTSIALPYSGAYIIRCRYRVSRQGSGLTFIDNSATFTATSSGDFSVNHLIAYYDIGLDCPGRLECTIE